MSGLESRMPTARRLKTGSTGPPSQRLWTRCSLQTSTIEPVARQPIHLTPVLDCLIGSGDGRQDHRQRQRAPDNQQLVERVHGRAPSTLECRPSNRLGKPSEVMWEYSPYMVLSRAKVFPCRP